MSITTEQLEAMLAAATPGPWRVSSDHGDEVMTGAGGESLMCDMTYYPWVPPSDDWPLIAAAPTLSADLIRLRAEVSTLRASEARMREALERADRALKPFADTVFNDNGDCTISDTYLLTDVDFCNAYSARNIARAALQGETK